MKRIASWFMIGLFGLSLIYLFKSRPSHSTNISNLKSQISNLKSDDIRLNINTASAGEFEALPGLGPVAAQRIIAYRETHGPLARTEDIMIIEGIGEQKYRALANLLRVE